jgi:hypothetical protein
VRPHARGDGRGLGEELCPRGIAPRQLSDSPAARSQPWRAACTTVATPASLSTSSPASTREDAAAFETLVRRLRATAEWTYVDREVDIRLERDLIETRK